MKIALLSIMVDDQDKALAFYTEKLGFITKQDVPMGGPRWITVASPEGPEGVEVSLEPNNNPELNGGAQAFQRLLFEKGIAWTAFAVDDVHKEYDRLKSLGVVFNGEPQAMGPVTIAIFDDTCGNLIQIFKVA